MMKGYQGEAWIYDMCKEDPVISKHNIYWQGKCKRLTFNEYKSLNGRHIGKGKPDIMIDDVIAIESKNTSAIIIKEWLNDWFSRFDDIMGSDCYKFVLTPDDTKYTSFANRGIRFEERVCDIHVITRSKIMKRIRDILAELNPYLKALKKSFIKVKSLTFNPLQINNTDNYPYYPHSVYHTNSIDHTTVIKLWYKVFMLQDNILCKVIGT